MKIKYFIYIFIILLVTAGIFDICMNRKFSSKDQINIYFGKVINKKNLEPQPVKRKISNEKTILFYAIEELLKGPNPYEEHDNYFTEIPASTKIIEIRETPEYITVNLSLDFESGGGSESMIYRIRQITYTVLDLIKEKPVYLELQNERVKYIGGEGIEVPQPLERDYFDQKDI